jgi:hypothetical protein
MRIMSSRKIMMRAIIRLGLFVAALQCASAQTSPHGAIKISCDVCHGSDSWKMLSDAQFSHASTGFDLTGTHSKVECRSCHEGLKFTGLTADCQVCHTDVHKGEVGPNCLRCHSTQDWKITDMIQRHQQTRFPLVGQHIAVPCQSCHGQSAFQQYSGTPTTCVGCHRSDYLNSQNPNHTQAGFSTDCMQCHQVNAESWGSGFNHQLTAFPLTGAHLTTQCNLCHTNNAFKSTPQDCYTCHTSNFNSVQNPNHIAGQFPQQCVTCHSTAAWSPATFDHSTTRFALSGKHASLQCQDCHAGGNYHLVYTSCTQCHQNDFNQTTNPNHAAGGFSTTCTTCHTMVSWAPATFDHSATKFNLTGAHTSVACGSCHVNNNFQISYTNCFMCHQTDYQNAASPNHSGGNFAHTCDQCHTTSVWTPSTFSHANTSFPLAGAHQSVPCASCHVNNVFAGLHQNCIDCHQSDFKSAPNPNHVTGGFSTACTTCHSMTAWSPASFDHSGLPFQVSGAHTSLQCQNCHVNGNYQLTFITCFQCHQNDFNQTANPNHLAGNYNHQCSICHSTASWSSAAFDHSVTKFNLTGAHVATPCTSCHINNNFQLSYTSCYMCHQPDFQKASNPNHAAGNFAHLCDQCHTTSVWSPSTFNHATTSFPLVGAHQSVACVSCHINNVFAGLHQNCIDCHQSDFNAAPNPNHVAGGFSTACTTCHSMNGWSTTSFNHSTTKFPLTGKHTAVQCQTCHTGGNYLLTFMNCFQCHQSDFNQASNPNHLAGNFGHTCDQCHTTTVWSPSTFNHGMTTYPLVGAHQTVQCASCHVNNVFAGLHRNCFDCHQADFNGTNNPNHVSGGFSITCTTCHSMNGWDPATFDHTATKFPLTGAHLAVTCSGCHVNNNFQISYTNCYTCHQTDYQSASNPNHAAGGFAQTCDQCHTTSVWSPSTFNHTNTAFPLVGAHQAVPCASCHVNNVFAGLHQNCIDCHQTDFNGTTNPNHVTGLFSTTCTTCHSMTGWTPATFDHSTTKLPLTGAHLTVQCQNCHTSGNYQLVYTNCYQCHQSDYQGAANPKHSAGYPQTCDAYQCHTTASWTSSTFNHDSQFFKIYSGAHHGNWTLCTQCHQVSADLSNYSCTTGCHAKSGTDGDHSGVSGYVYSSPRCYSCHRGV